MSSILSNIGNGVSNFFSHNGAYNDFIYGILKNDASISLRIRLAICSADSTTDKVKKVAITSLALITLPAIFAYTKARAWKVLASVAVAPALAFSANRGIPLAKRAWNTTSSNVSAFKNYVVDSVKSFCKRSDSAAKSVENKNPEIEKAE